MQKSLRLTLILTVVFLGLCGWYFFYEKEARPKKTEAEEKSKQLTALSPDEIQELVVQRFNPKTTDTDKIRLRKLGQDWNLLEPVQDQADSSAITSMLGSLTSTKQERVVEEKPKDLEPFGLKQPSLRIEAKKDANAAPVVVELGKDTPVGFSIYAKIANQPAVFRVSRSLKTSFDKDVKSIRNKIILNLSRFEIGEVEIHNQKETLLLKKNDHDQWELARENIPADLNQWNKTFNSLVDIKANDFVSEDGKNLAAYGLAPPRVKVSLTKGKERTRVGLWLGKVKDKVYAKREDKPVVYQVDKDVLDKLERPASEYRNLELANFNRFDVKRIKLEHGKEVIELLKDNAIWSMPTEPKIQIDSAKVDGLLTKLQDTRITKYLAESNKHDAVKEPQVIVRLFEKKENSEAEKVTLKFRKKESHQILAERGGLSIPFLIKEDDFKKINLKKQDFLKKAEEKPVSSKEPGKKS